MMMKFFEDAAALCYGSMILTTNMNKNTGAGSFDALHHLEPQARRAPSGKALIHSTRRA